jgi:hypothetical protein
MSAAPIFYTTPRTTGGLNATAASTGKTLAAPTNLTEIAVGGANGSLVQQVVVENTTTSAPTATNILRFFLYDGTNYFLKVEHAISGATAGSATVPGYRALVPELAGLRLPSATWKLYFGIGTYTGAQDVYLASVDVLDA